MNNLSRSLVIAFVLILIVILTFVTGLMPKKNRELLKE